MAIKKIRSRVRIISYASAAVLVLGGFAAGGWWSAYTCRRDIEYSYQRALTELSEHVNDIDTELQKADYSGTAPMFVQMSAEILRDTGAAKADLAQIPLLRARLEGTYKFISQAGDYANTLAQNASFSQKIAPEDRTKVSGLRTYAQKLSSQLGDMVQDMQSGRLTIFTAQSAFDNISTNSQPQLTATEKDFDSINSDFKSMPSLIYDGPFSDSVEQKTSLFLKDKAQISRAQAQQKAAGFLGAPLASVVYASEAGGRLPSYNFTSGTVSVSVSKAGGFVTQMLDGAAAAQQKLSQQQATQKAAEFLKSRGISGMTQSYYHADNNICIVNFAFEEQGIVCYPDLIKVGISMQTGRAVSFDATGYLMNHHTRTFPAPHVTEDSVKKLVSPTLTVQKVSRAVIPTNGGGEALCFACLCKSRDGKSVLDYFDEQTGRETQLLILLQTDGGTLTV